MGKVMEDVAKIADRLFADCLLFVRDQSEGEWGDKIERDDAKKLALFVAKHRVEAVRDHLTREQENGS